MLCHHSSTWDRLWYHESTSRLNYKATELTFKHFIKVWICRSSTAILFNSNSSGLLVSIFFFFSIFIWRAWSICYRACCFSLSLVDIISRILAFTVAIWVSICVFYSWVRPASFSFLRWFWISVLYFWSTSYRFFSIRFLSLSFYSFCARSVSEIYFYVLKFGLCQLYWVVSGFWAELVEFWWLICRF